MGTNKIDEDINRKRAAFRFFLAGNRQQERRHQREETAPGDQEHKIAVSTLQSFLKNTPPLKVNITLYWWQSTTFGLTAQILKNEFEPKREHHLRLIFGQQTST